MTTLGPWGPHSPARLTLRRWPRVGGRDPRAGLRALRSPRRIQGATGQGSLQGSGRKKKIYFSLNCSGGGSWRGFGGLGAPKRRWWRKQREAGFLFFPQDKRSAQAGKKGVKLAFFMLKKKILKWKGFCGHHP